MPYRILIVAPDMGLDTTPDIVSAASDFSPKILNGTVTVAQVLDHISRGGYQVLHFATHGRAHVLQMSDGIMEEDMLEQAIRASGTVRVLFLNACRSIHITAEVYNNTGLVFGIGWPGDATDRLAGEWARLFYRALAMDPLRAKRAAEVANASLLKGHDVPAGDLPVVLNGRVVAMREEVERLQAEMANPWAIPVPYWVVAVNGAVLVLLVLAVLVLSVGR